LPASNCSYQEQEEIMFTRIKKYFQTQLEQESPQSRWQRVRIGILVGVIGAVFYAIVTSVINIISYPTLHMAVNWSNALTTWLIVSLALALSGFIVGWPTEEVKAIVGGGVILTVLLLVVNTILFIAAAKGDQSYFQVLVASLPMVGVCVLLALALRQVINKLTTSQKEESIETRRKVFTKYFAIVIVVGMIGGLFSRFDGTAVTTLTALNDRLQSSDLSSSSKVRFPPSVAEKAQLHYGTESSLFVRSAAASVGALDVTVRFSDGYVFTCQIPTASGFYVIVDSCSEGNHVK
jgi:hypothetical protein